MGIIVGCENHSQAKVKNRILSLILFWEKGQEVSMLKFKFHYLHNTLSIHQAGDI
jgi:hypothetical protein